MSQPYVGEIRMFGGSFAPVGWAFCNGAIMPIVENETLFNLIGTTYGGDGQETYGLPDLQGRFPIHQGSGFTIGEKSGTETVTLSTNQLPIHTHPPLASTDAANQLNPTNAFWAANESNSFAADDPTQSLNAAMVQPTGGSQPHENMSPYLAVSFILSLFGIFPTQN